MKPTSGGNQTVEVGGPRSGPLVIDEKNNGRRPIPLALCHDPPPDPSAPAQTLPQAIPSSGDNLNAVLYSAAGFGPQPTVLLLHGLPGNEQNLDCAQTIRRSGWNVLAIHYRGSWGGPGTFTLTHCLEDAAASLDWLQDRGNHTKFRIDPNRIVIMGHSMGGFVAALTAAEHPDILGTALISGVDLTRAFGGDDEGPRRRRRRQECRNERGSAHPRRNFSGRIGRRGAPQFGAVASHFLRVPPWQVDLC